MRSDGGSLASIAESPYRIGVDWAITHIHQKFMRTFQVYNNSVAITKSVMYCTCEKR